MLPQSAGPGLCRAMPSWCWPTCSGARADSTGGAPRRPRGAESGARRGRGSAGARDEGGVGAEVEEDVGRTMSSWSWTAGDCKAIARLSERKRPQQHLNLASGASSGGDTRRACVLAGVFRSNASQFSPGNLKFKPTQTSILIGELRSFSPVLSGRIPDHQRNQKTGSRETTVPDLR